MSAPSRDEQVTRVQLTLQHDFEFTAGFPDLPAIEPLHLDEHPPLGGDHGPNPAALLASAVGNCLAASLLFCLKKSRVDVQGMQATAEAHIGRNEQGRFRIQGIDVVVSPTLAPADAERSARCQALFEDFCIVTESVRHGIPVRVTLDVATGTPAAAPAPPDGGGTP